jgi:tetratricopeptide (TPR) repeat protein
MRDEKDDRLDLSAAAYSPRRLSHFIPHPSSLILFFLLAGCDTTAQDKFRLFNEDGIHNFSRGNYPQARDSFEQALVLRQDDPTVIFNLAQTQERLGDAKSAEEGYRDCLTRDPNLVDARQAYADFLYKKGRPDDAKKLIDVWAVGNEHRADALVLQAWELRQKRAYPTAYDKLQSALVLEPHNPRALTELGILYEKMNLPERSLVLYERALATNPNLFEVRERIEKLKTKGVDRPAPLQ